MIIIFFAFIIIFIKGFSTFCHGNNLFEFLSQLNLAIIKLELTLSEHCLLVCAKLNIFGFYESAQQCYRCERYNHPFSQLE